MAGDRLAIFNNAPAHILKILKTSSTVWQGSAAEAVRQKTEQYEQSLCLAGWLLLKHQRQCHIL